MQTPKVTEVEAQDFDIPSSASTPPASVEPGPAAPQRRAPTLPVPRIEPLDPEQPPIPSIEFPADLKGAFGLVQNLQRKFDSAPVATRSQRLTKQGLGRLLERAKAHCAKLQAGPPAPAPGVHPMANPVSGESVAALRKQITQSL